jgi:hypothetical protein
MAGQMVVGPDPPDGVDVQTATVTVPAPMPDRTAMAGRDPVGYEPIARAVARAVADGLLPSNRVDASVYRESPTAIATSTRYRTVASETDVRVDGLLARGNVAAAHSRIVDGLTELFLADMRQRFDSPEAAAASVQTGSVEIVVRRWVAGALGFHSR